MVVSRESKTLRPKSGDNNVSGKSILDKDIETKLYRKMGTTGQGTGFNIIWHLRVRGKAALESDI